MFEGSSHTASQSQGDVDLYVKDRCWVTLNGAKLMWLPREYRPRCSAVHGNMIALGNESGGGVIIIGFRAPGVSMLLF